METNMEHEMDTMRCVIEGLKELDLMYSTANTAQQR